MPKKILIVDDSLFIRNMLKDILSKNYDIVEADCGADGIMQYSREQPDLVLLDIIMPDGTLEGINVLQNIHERNAEALVIMITAVGQDQIINECKSAGASDYITKPFEAEEVIEKVQQYVGKLE
ncbi:MAG: response regulator [Coxiellaceae bacterium]|nr:response regulator [Coxiellaceae bacterium]